MSDWPRIKCSFNSVPCLYTIRKSVYLISLLGHVSDKADLQLGTVLRYSTSSTFQVDNQKNSVPRRFQKLYSINRLGNMETCFVRYLNETPTDPPSPSSHEGPVSPVRVWESRCGCSTELSHSEEKMQGHDIANPVKKKTRPMVYYNWVV